ncbi:MAG: S8 family serine peptidase [Chryseobacterium sp.]|jgi:hypothetical protein|uniref:S8 family serine peptidase n=1 Tax=Chryseobacterium sp. TaxID=1871047 RepID=UPI00282770CC|nr:S8 family serine peptidase [Chryseobacterium sp.]MDR2235911.1 S8 family serine peptidase [Chryseobacterium sp.]
MKKSVFHSKILLAGLLSSGYFSAQEKADSIPVREQAAIKEIAARFSSESARQKDHVQRLKALGHQEFIIEKDNYKQLIGADEQGRPLYYTTFNAGASKMAKTSKMYSGGGLGLDISGQNMLIGQWDFSKPRLNHQLLVGKINYPASQNQIISRHSTHIAGTVAGNNTSDSNAQGIAYSASLNAYDWVNDVSEMLTEAGSGMLVANNSYGFDPMYLQTYQFGKYNTTAQNWDVLMYRNPYFQIVKAVGNARDLNPAIVPQAQAKGGYDLLEGAGIAKNVLVVGAVKKNENMTADDQFATTSFSSYGPTDDGRIKPDISAPGEGIYSAIETYNAAYGYYNGTSSAAAVVSGAVTLLQQYWKSINPNYLWSSSVRAIVAHTANDRGPLGPDYAYGWGLINAERATQLIYSNNKSTLVKEENLANGKEYRLYAVASKANQQPFVATLAWTDPAGNIGNAIPDDEAKALIHDLDISIIKKDNSGNTQRFYPWKLGGITNYTAPATRNSVNSVDNIEKVEIENPDGLYQIIVKHKGNLQEGNQNFSLILSGVSFCYSDDLYVLVREKDNIDAPNFVGTAKNIKASNVIKSTADVTYKAASSVELLPDASGGSGTIGFEVEPGALFLAYVDPDCGAGTDPSLLYQAQSAVRANKTETVSTPSKKMVAEVRNELNVYPNPTHDELNISFSLEKPSKVTLALYDTSGKEVLRQESSQNFPNGEFMKTLNVKGLPGGAYILYVETLNRKISKKVIIK